MNTEQTLAEARHYLAVGRYDKVIEQCKQALASDPEDAQALMFMGLAEFQLQHFKEAYTHFQNVIKLNPDVPSAHIWCAEALIAQDRIDDAQQHVDTAIQIAPNEPNAHAAQARIHINRQQWQRALDAAERSLKIDPEHDDASNLRSVALTKLRRTADAADETIEQLRRNPDNALAHANRGWQCLHSNDPKQALTHFQESLRIEPGNDWAKAGLVEALKARNPIYRILLAYFLWMTTMTPGMRWGIIIGGYLLYRFGNQAAQQTPELGMILWPFLAVYLLFVLLTWVGVPTFNLLLMVSPYGRYALAWRERLTAGVFGGLLLTVITSLAIGWFGAMDQVLNFGVMLGMTTLLIVAALQAIGTNAFKIRAGIAGGLVLLMAGVVVLDASGQTEYANRVHLVFLVSFVASIWFTALSGARSG